MHHKTSIERILAIEEAMDVTAIRYKGLRMWPYVRMQLWRRLMQPDKFAPPATIGLKYLAQTLSQGFFKPAFYVPYLEHTRRHRDNLSRLSKAGPIDVLLFSSEKDHFDLVKARHYSRYLDPMAELIKTKYTYLKVELISDLTPKTLPRFEHTHFLDAVDFIRCDAQRSLITAFQNNGDAEILEEGRTLTRLLAGIRFDLALTEEYLMVEAEKLLHYSRYFHDVLLPLNPKAVFLVGYDSEFSMALIAACKKLGIKTVDMQRSGIGAYHGMYTHWRNIPPEGFELLPDYFWCWSKQDVENLQQGRPVFNTHHVPIIGGNQWLTKWVDNDQLMPGKSADSYLSKFVKYERLILVSLQKNEDCIPDNLIEAIRNAPADWYWMIRVYPGMDYKIDEITSLFVDLHVNNVEIALASKIPVYRILSHVDWHVSQGSTVCLEALNWGVPSILINPEGKELFQTYVDKGIFFYALSSEAIVERLSTLPPTIRTRNEHIVTDRVYALDALFEIVTSGDPVEAS